MRFTVAALHKRLGQLIHDGHGRKPVAVDKGSFVHNCEADGCVILCVAGLGVRWVPLMDDDGGTKWRKDGTEAGRSMIILAGDAGSSMKGELLDEKGR